MAPPNPPPTSLPTQPTRQCSACHEIQPQDQFVPLQRARALLGELTTECLQCRSRRSKRARPASNDLHLPPPPPQRAQPPPPRFHRLSSYTVSQAERRQSDAASLRARRARQRAGLPEPEEEVNTVQPGDPGPQGPATEEQGLGPGLEDGIHHGAANTGPDTGAGDPTGLETGLGLSEGRPAPRNREEQRAGQLGRLLNHGDPAINVDPLSGPALTDEDERLLRNFNEAIEEDMMEYCPRCHERWFGMSLHAADGICNRCHTRDKNIAEGQPFLMSAENHTLVPEPPAFLPALTDVEEILIARIKVAIQVWLVKGAQWKYTGHVVNFMRDTGKIYRKLPTLPEDADIVLIRPARGPDGSRAQFRKRLTVRREVVKMWLEYLKENHSGYRDIDIDHNALSQLPHDDTVDDRVQREEYPLNPEDQNEPAPAEDDLDPDIDFAAVPNVNADGNVTRQLAEILQAQRQRSGQNQAPANAPDVAEAQQPGSIPWFTEPVANVTPLSEWDHSQAIMSLAFPSLFPTGEGDFVQPREREVSYADYVVHLMRYSNGRFASHSRFPYFVFNTRMRQQSCQLSSFFVNRFNRPEGRDVSIDDISAALSADSTDHDAQALLNSVVRSAGSLRGTRPFWNGKKHQLMSYIRALGKPSLFMTLSAADLQWDALARSMPDYRLWKQASGKDRIRIATKNLRLNPHIAATHFLRRFNTFLQQVLIPKFNVKDYWMRIEFQGRGSSHSHFFLWCEGPPPFDVESQAGRNQFAELWHRHVRAVNPEPERISGLYATSALQSDDLELKNTMANLSDIVNRVQLHKCNASCQRRKKGAAEGEEYCRFYFPRALRERGVVSKEHNPNHWSFIPATNDSRLNPYNRLVSMAWRANTDISPCTSMHAVCERISGRLFNETGTLL